MTEYIYLECGHKLRGSTFKLCNQLGTCPRQTCLCPLSEANKERIAKQVEWDETPLWELYTYGRPATQAEKEAREPPRILLPNCAGITLKGTKCRCVVLASNGKFCWRHVPK
jgi:hypothetical protein